MIDWSTWEIFFSRAGIDSVTAILCATQRKAVSQTRLMPQADTSLRLDWNQKTGTQAGCDWPHARHTVVLYHLVCSFLQKCSFLWIYQRKWHWLSLRTLLSLKGSSSEVFARVGRNFSYTKHCWKILIFPCLLSLFRNVTWTSTCPIPLMSFCFNFSSATLMAMQRSVGKV